MRRFVAPGAIAVVVVALVVVLLGSGTSHVIHARFNDAGQLVTGDQVTVAGHQVGQVGGIALAPNGLADVELDISDDSAWPLRAGTTATISQLSLTGVANRYVALQPSAAGPALPDGGTIGPDHTHGIVDLDILLNSLTPRVRTAISQVLKAGAYAFSGATPAQANAADRLLNPALAQTAALGREVVADRFALERLVASAAQVSGTLAARTGALSGAIAQTASWLSQAAGERVALADALTRAPAVLAQTRATLADISGTLTAVNPALADLRPVAPGLAALLRAVAPAAAGLVPTIKGLDALVTPAEAQLTSVTRASPPAVAGLRSLTPALQGITPILSGLRPYTPDQLAGFFGGVGGFGGASYDANGHYARVAPIIAGTTTSLTGVLNVLGGLTKNLPALTGTETGKRAACPGGGGPPAFDDTNGWATPDAAASVSPICNPADNQP